MPGGLCSLLLYILIIVFIIVKVSHLFGNARDSERRAEIQTDLTKYLLPYTNQIRAMDFKSNVFMAIKGHEPG